MATEHFHTGTHKNEVLRVLQRQQSLKRMYVLIIGFLVLFVVVAGRLAVIQIRDAESLREIALDQYQSRETIPPVRGLILDRNLSILASNVIEYTLIADPGVIAAPDTVIPRIARGLGVPAADIAAKIRDKSTRYVVLASRLSEEQAAPFKRWKCYGIRLRPTPRRHYNFDALASTVLGYTNIDNIGQTGVELELNRDLAGQNGFIVYQRDANGRRRPEIDYPHRDPVNGRTVVLTLQQTYQAIAEEELAKGVEKYAAQSGRCVILQPRTGEILAMANAPGINPNRLRDYTKEQIGNAQNRAVTDLYEPGSTFKIVVMSAALNEKLYKPDDVLSAENGSWKYSPTQKPIVDDHPAAYHTLRSAFVHSSNIISAKLAEKLGAERFYRYARNFGFGVRTGIELPGEVRGELKKPSDWDWMTLKYLGFGYGLSVTSLQIACAYSAIANDGVLMRPFIRKWLLDENRNIIDETVPQVIRRVVTSETAATMRTFMQGVVDSGTARLARIDGMPIAGKTGTSQRIVDKSYSAASHVASFVGFFPADDPKILILVILDDPKNGYYGGAVAAPIFREIAMRIINSSPEFAKTPEPLLTASDVSTPIPVPDVRGMQTDLARTVLASHGFTMKTDGRGMYVVAQTPAQKSSAKYHSDIHVTLGQSADGSRDATVVVPDLTGMSIRHAMTCLRGLRLVPSPAGSGIVRGQLPRPGERVERGTRCTILAEPNRIYTANVY